MTRAMKAAARSQIVAILDRHRLDADEVVAIALDLAWHYGQKGGWSYVDLVVALEDILIAESFPSAAP